MNADRPTPPGSEHMRSLQILDELANNDSLTQRDLSSRLGIALGLVNSYIKNLIAKGYITVKSIPPKRYTYYLTPKGFAEKTRLTYDLLHDYTRIYREAKNNLKNLFREMHEDGIKRIVFAGADEVAEIAYITLQETDIELVGVVDLDRVGKKFFRKTILPINNITTLNYDSILVTTYLQRDSINRELSSHGISGGKIRNIFVLNSRESGKSR